MMQRTRTRASLLASLALPLALMIAAAPQETPDRAEVDEIVEGIDVSHYQGAIDWPVVEKAGIGFAYIKATQGTKWVDPRFAENWKQVGKTGIRRGAYHFFEPDVDGTAQAKHFLSIVSLQKGDLLPVVDVETSGPELAANLELYLAEIKRQTGLDAMIYVSPAFWNRHLGERSTTPWPNPLWIAEYGVSTPKETKGIGPWIVWQYTQDGRVKGVEGPVDRDRARMVPHAPAPPPAGTVD
ncbi:MAG: glycoside hydrolase family 25 protein [Planctomycetota bacterium]|nr:glycoside hydrolase family 25 protein [Planctomycetota bacterium]